MCGPCATKPREPCQAGDRAALSGLFCVPQQACTSMFRNFFIKEGYAGMFFSLVARRARRTFISLKRSAVKGAALTLCLAVISFIGCSLFANRDALLLSDLIMLITLIFIPAWALFFILDIKNYGVKVFHRYDEDIIGGAFTGINRSSARFEDGLLTFHSGDFRGALDIFTDMDTGSYKMTREEQGVLSFFRGRCYQIMGLYPNALLCYNKAEENGFQLDELPLFVSRCCSETGDTAGAVAELEKILDTDHKYSGRARYEIGMIYVRLDDAETALKWFDEAIERREAYADALGGAAVAHTMLRRIDKGEECFRLALLNNIENEEEFMSYFKKIQAAVILKRNDGYLRR